MIHHRPSKNGLIIYLRAHKNCAGWECNKIGYTWITVAVNRTGVTIFRQTPSKEVNMNTVFFIGTVLLLGTLVHTQRTGPPPVNSSPPTRETHHESRRVCRENVTCDVCTRLNGTCSTNGQCCHNVTYSERPPHERCFDMNGTCGSNCTQKGGRCDAGKCCFSEEPPHERCYPVDGTCGRNCTEKGGRCDAGKCCFREGPPHERCIVMNGTCGSNCTQKGGRCDAGKCCFGEEPPHERCYPVDGTCGRNCTEKGGRCDAGKCCFREGPPHERCYVMNGTCGSNCTHKGGRCDAGKCCFGEEPPHERCYPVDGTCGRNCTEKGGRCEAGKCCFSKGPPHERCFVTNGTCGSNCTQKGGRCDGGKCCFDEEPDHKRCFHVKGTCGSNCTQKGGRCDGGKCCFDEEPPHGRCIPMDGTCGRNCMQRGGRCVGSKCCFSEDDKDHDDDKSWDDNDSKDKDDSRNWDDGKDHGRDSEDSDDDEEYRDHMGMKVRCTRAKCTESCKRRGGFCLAGKCCYKKTEKEAQSRCEKEKRRLNAVRERQTPAGSRSDVVHINCTSTGSFLSRCQGNECHCLNASSGERVGQSKRVATFNKNSCDEVQKKTKVEHLNFTSKLSSRRMSDFSRTELEEMKVQLKNGIESRVPVNAVVRLFEGSVMAEIEMTTCLADCPATANTSDLYSFGMEIISQIEEGNIVLEVSGQTLIPTEPEITGITTTAMLEAMEKDTEVKLRETEDKMVTITIALVVVAVVVVLMSIGVACYCYSRNNKLKMKQAYFNNIQAKENPAYMKA